MPDTVKPASPITQRLWIASIPVILIYALFWQQLNDPIKSLGWHLIHGFHIERDGHSFRTPIFWRGIEVNRGIILRRSLKLQINIDKSVAGTRTEQQAKEFQEKTVAGYNNSSLHPHFFAETIHARKLTFYCAREESDEFYALFTCAVPTTDWEVGVTGANANIEQVRSILAATQ